MIIFQFLNIGEKAKSILLIIGESTIGFWASYWETFLDPAEQPIIIWCAILTSLGFLFVCYALLFEVIQ